MKKTLSILIILLALISSCSPRSEYGESRRQVRTTQDYKYKIVTSGYVFYTDEYTIDGTLIHFTAYRDGSTNKYTTTIYTLEYIRHD